MPSFDVVSEVDFQEVRNAVDQANREIGNRYDFKGGNTRVEQEKDKLTVFADDDFKVGQARDILEARLAKRDIDLGCLVRHEVQKSSGDKARQDIDVRHGIDAELSKRIVKDIKASKHKVQAAIQGDRVRISGKKRDDLQEVIEMMRGNKSIGLPLQYINFRD